MYTLTQYKDQIANDLLHKNYFIGKLAFDFANIISGKPTERSYQIMSWVTSLKFIRFQTKYTFVFQHEYQFNSNFTDNFGFFLHFSSNIYLNKFAQTTQYMNESLEVSVYCMMNMFVRDTDSIFISTMTTAHRHASKFLFEFLYTTLMVAVFLCKL